MSSIAAGDKIKRFISVQPARFKYLVRLSVEKLPAWDGIVACGVEVVLTDDLTPESGRLKLKFMQSTDVKIGNLNVTFRCLIVIRDISDRQLERTTYHVVEEEAGAFSLNCQDFEFEVTK
jgi:hypothetical protein